MKTIQFRTLFAVLGTVLLTGCPDDETTPSDTEGTGTGDDDGGTMPPTTMPPTTMPPTTDPTPGTDDTGTPMTDDTGTPMTDDGMTTDDGPMTDDGSSSSGGGSESTSSGEALESSSSDTGAMATCPQESLSNTLPVTIVGTTVGGEDAFILGCTDGNSTEYTYDFTAPVAGSYTFDTEGSAIDTILAVYESCDGNNLACNDDIAYPANLNSEVAVELAENQTVIVVVDGYNESGAFTLNVTETVPPPEICAFGGVEMAACADTATGDMTVEDTLSCDETGAPGFFFFDLYQIPVMAGDCVFVSADNIGAAGPTGATAADLVAYVVDQTSGDFFVFDDELPCTDPAFGDYACPEGGVTATSDGTMLIGIGQYGGKGCPEGSPYTLTVGINGVDFDPGTPVTQDEPSDCG
jgi:hypothetical protein